MQANEGKSLSIEVDGKTYLRIPIKTHVVSHTDLLTDVLKKYVLPHALPGDILFVSEKCVACTQSRAIPIKEVKPRPLARFLSRFVQKTPSGIGLGMPETMEMALVEIGVLRILVAAFVSAFGKLFGKRGWFYVVAGEKARSIDGPTPYTLPPYNEYVVLGPKNPKGVASELAAALGFPVAVVDINDLGGNILGLSGTSLSHNLLVRILSDNPLGQASEQTPCGIIRLEG